MMGADPAETPPVKVPFRLIRRPAARPAEGHLLIGADAAAVLSAWAGPGTETERPALFRTAAGVLMVLPEPAESAVPGAVRMRRIAAHLWVPADADLSPALLDDEAADLTAGRGLVFLPDGTAAAFAPDAPMSVGELLSAGPLRREAWTAPIAPKPPADRLAEIVLEVPPAPPESVLRPPGAETDPRGRGPASGAGAAPPGSAAGSGSGTGVGAESAGAGSTGAGAAASPPGTAAGWWSAFRRAMSRGLSGLARMLTGRPPAPDRPPASGRPPPADPPPLTPETIRGQEAALRELLRQFRAGDVDSALRRALPISGEPGRGESLSGSTRLPEQGADYSLARLLGFGGGAASVWVGGADLHRELGAEYRRAAEAAVRSGDFRRAAYIYGRLLGDYRTAADCLMRAGLFADAAVLYRNRVGDLSAAARAYEQAGDADRALELHRRRGDHLAAAALLARLGENEAATAEYVAAADALVLGGHGFRAAGRLMLDKAGRADLAFGYFLRGWKRSTGAEAAGCAVEIVRHHAAARDTTELAAWLRTADERLARPGQDAAAAHYYGELARFAGGADAPVLADEMLDRARLGLAAQLRRRVGAGDRTPASVTRLFGAGGPWSAAMVADALHAIGPAVADTVGEPLRPGEVRLDVGRVAAACCAPDTGDVFVAGTDGAVVCFRPASGDAVPVAGGLGPVQAIAADVRGTIVAVLRGGPGGQAQLSGFTGGPDGLWAAAGHRFVGDGRPVRLASAIVRVGHPYVAAWDGSQVAVLTGPMLLPAAGWQPAPAPLGVPDVLLLPLLGRGGHGPTVILSDEDGGLIVRARSAGPWHAAPLGFRPAAWLQPHADAVEMLGVSESFLNWASLEFRNDRLSAVTRAVRHRIGSAGYAAAAFLGPGRVAAVAAREVEWLSVERERFGITGRTTIPDVSPVAAFRSAPTDELIIVGADGALLRVPLPT
jgi:tetratricopeptide (TPR) repeat protein